MKQSNAIKFEKIETTSGYEWAAHFEDIPAVCGGGKTRIEAATELVRELEVYANYIKGKGYADYDSKKS